MSTYFVTYTLKDSTDYTKLSKRLKKYPNWAKLFARLDNQYISFFKKG